MQKKSPRRKFHLKLTLGADDAETLRRGIRALAFDLEGFETCLEWPYRSFSGSPDYGYSLDIERDPEMTPERYQEELNQWIEDHEIPTVDKEP